MIRLIVIIFSLLFCLSCQEKIEHKTELNNGELITVDSVPTSFSSDIEPSLKQSCSCHYSFQVPRFNNFFTDIVGSPSTNIDKNLIEPSSPEQSALFLAISQMGGMPQMPPNTSLDKNLNDLLEKWISEGALDN